jgi:nucleoside-diphosphate-sugar epimerase
MEHCRNDRAAMNGTLKILVTGAGGFLGSRIVERLLLERRAEVRVLLRTFRGASRIATLPVEYRRGDVTDISAVTDAAMGCDVVIHCASGIEPGVAPESTSTCLGTRIAAKACAQAKAKLVHISSCSVYGIPDARVVDETAPHRPRHRNDTYALAKIAAEANLRAFCRKHGLKAAILQPTMIFGPYSQEWTLTPLAMLEQSDIAMPEGDHSICNVVYVDDVASAAFLAINACDTSCESYLINGKDLPTWSEYLSRHTDMGALGKVISVSREKLDQLRAEMAQSSSLSRVLLGLLRNDPRIRAAILSTRMASNAYSLLQKCVSRRLMTVIRVKLTGRQEAGPPTIGFARVPDLPLRLPPPHFLELASQTHRFSGAKAARLLGYSPRHSVDTALPLLRAWAKWSRLVGVIPMR